MLPEMVELLMFAVPLLKMAPPFVAVLFEKVEPLTVRKELGSKLRIPAPFIALKLPVKTESPVEFWSGVFGWSSMNNSALDRPDGERHEESLEH